MKFFKIIIPLLFAACSSSQKNTKQISNNISTDSFRVAFYNIENLFDTIDNPNTSDEEFTPNSQLHWNSKVYTQKLQNMAQVINDLKPDILGLAEIENKQVIIDLLKTGNFNSYSIVHFESPDERGIDVALVFNSENFSLIKSNTINVHLNDTNKTRDILKVTLKNVNTNEPISVFINHWPSRRGGIDLTKNYRAKAAMELKSALDACTEKTIAIGDFNDSPKDSSILKILNSGYPGDTFYQMDYFNLARFIKTSNEGSHYYQGHWDMLDQMIISKSMWQANTGTKYLPFSFKIFKPVYIVETTGKYIGNPKRSIAGNKWLNGYSDHLPIYADFISMP